MAVDTKPNFSSNKFEQCSGDIMNLSGCTQIYGKFDIETGATLTICNDAGVGKILTSNSTGIATWQDAAVGGITSISGGSGMNFSPITTSGEIVLGTPNAIINTSTDVSSGTTHHHAFSASTFVNETQGILVSGSTNQFYLDDTYIANAVLPDLHTVDNITANQSLGNLPSGQTLGMIYITNNGTATASVDLGTTTTGNDITPYESISVAADEDVSITVNMRLSVTETKTMYINSDDWTNVDLDVQWAHISYDNVPLPTGGTGGGLSSSSNGLTDDGTTVELGGTLTSSTTISGASTYDLYLGNENSQLANFNVNVDNFVTIGANAYDVNSGLGVDYCTVQLYNCYDDGGSVAYTKFCLDRSDGILLEFSGTSNVAHYADDYSPNFTARSIPDVAFVTGQTGGDSYWESTDASSVGLCSPYNTIDFASNTLNLTGDSLNILTDTELSICNVMEGGVNIMGLIHEGGTIKSISGGLSINSSDSGCMLRLVSSGDICIDLASATHNLFMPNITGCTNSDVLYYDSSTAVVSYGAAPTGGTGSTSPAGSDTYIQFNDTGSFGADTKLRYDNSNNAFTAGWRTGTVGENSVVLGGFDEDEGAGPNIASGSGSYAHGNCTCATGCLSTTWGDFSCGTGNYSTAWGFAEASGDGSTAWGSSTSIGNNSTAWGLAACAIGDYSTAWGNGNCASGHTSTAWGLAACAIGDYSTAWGKCVSANDYLETTLGGYNIIGSGDTESWVATDNLFTIGNGVSTTRSNAFQIKKNGNLYLPNISGCTSSNILYYDSSDGSVSYATPSNAASGSDGSMQYNNGGTLNGTCLNWDDSLNHMGWGISASTGTMFRIAKDASYDDDRTIMEFTGLETDEEMILSQFKVDVGAPSWGSTIFTNRITGYICGNQNCDLFINSSFTGGQDYAIWLSHLHMCGSNISAVGSCDLQLGDSTISCVDICSILKLNPTTTPSTPTSGTVYYSSASNKLNYYNGTTWVVLDASSGGGVTSVAAGNGLDFTTISTTGSVTMGTPSNISNTSTNSVSSTSHTHNIDVASIVGGNDGNILYNNGDTIGGTCLNWDDSTNTFGWGIAGETDTNFKVQISGTYNDADGKFLNYGITDSGFKPVLEIGFKPQSTGGTYICAMEDSTSLKIIANDYMDICASHISFEVSPGDSSGSVSFEQSTTFSCNTQFSNGKNVNMQCVCWTPPRYIQAAQPTVAAYTMMVWIDNDDSNRTYILYNNGTSTVKTELT